MEFDEPMFDLMKGNIPGVNLEEGAKRLGGNKAKYIKILSLFLESQTKAMEELLKVENNADKVILAHSCKGAGSNMSADDISHAASLIEEKLNIGESVETSEILSLKALIEKTLETFNQIAKAASLSSHIEKKEETVFSDADLKEQISLLQISLQEFDIQVGDKLTKLQKNFPQWFCQQDEFKRLEEAINQFDFITAEEHLMALDFVQKSA